MMVRSGGRGGSETRDLWRNEQSGRADERGVGGAGLRYTSLAAGLVLSALIARALGSEGRGQYYSPLLVAQTLQAAPHLSVDAGHVFLYSQRRVSLADLVGNTAGWAMLGGASGVAVGCSAWLIFRDSLMAEVPLVNLALALAPLPFALHRQYLGNLLLLRGGNVTVQGIVLIGSLT